MSNDQPQVISALTLLAYSRDIVYWIENTIKLPNSNEYMKLYPHQKELLKSMEDEKFLMYNKPRRDGGTTLLVLYAIHCFLFKQNINIVFVAPTTSERDAVFGLFQHFIAKYAERKFSFRNQSSRIDIVPINSSSIRGRGIDIMLVDEGNQSKDFEEFYNSSVPAVRSTNNGKMIFFANYQQNHFYNNLIKIKQSNPAAKVITLKWYQIKAPSYQEQMAQHREDLGLIQFLREFEFGADLMGKAL